MASRRPMIFGEVLFDRFPDGANVLGGAPFNVAWHLQAFGAAPVFVSRVGDDDAGRDIRNAMAEWGMETHATGVDADRPTGAVQVSLENGQPRFDIVDDQAYDHIVAPEPVPEGIGLLYHGSLALRNPGSRSALARLKDTVDAPVFVDVNLRPPWWTAEGIRAAVQGARWIKLNDEELDLLVPQGSDQADRLLADLGAEAVFLTKGAAGAEAVTRSGDRHAVAPAAATTVVDTVGAGDAFASVLVLGLVNGWSLATILERAQSFASALVGVRGATVRDPGFYSPYRSDWSLT